MNSHTSFNASGAEWIGSIPDNWTLKRLKYLTTVKSELSDDGKEELLSVTERRGIVRRKDLREADEPLSRSDDLTGYRRVRKGDLVNNIMLVWKRGLGVSPYDGIVSPAYSVFSFNETCYPWFYNYLLRSDEYIAEFRRNSTGITMSRLRLYDDAFGRVFAHNPPLHEQQLISRFLDNKTAQIDSLIEKIEKKIELLKEQRTSLINQYVTKGLDPNVEMKDSGVEWIGKIPKHWAISKIKYVARLENGSTPKSENEVFWDGSIKWFTPTDFKNKDEIGNLNDSARHITTEGLNNSGCSLIDSTSILMTTRAPVGNVARISPPFTFNQGCKSLTPQNIDIDYLYFYLLTKSEVLNVLSNGTTFKELSTERLLAFELPIPPISEQVQLAELLTNLTTQNQKLVTLLEAQKSIAREYRQSLISSVVTGKIRVTEDMV